LRKEIKPRFPESLEKLRLAVRAYGNNARLARLTEVSALTISKIADGTTRFPWAQTVEAIWQVLEEPKSLQQPVQKERQPERRKDRAGKRQYGYVPKRTRVRRYQVRVGKPF
jgi:transcriptional regulator with XRE-family HTH domain